MSKSEGGEDLYTTQSDRHPDLLVTQEGGVQKCEKTLLCIESGQICGSMTVAPARLAPNTSPLFSNGLCT